MQKEKKESTTSQKERAEESTTVQKDEGKGAPPFQLTLLHSVFT